MKREAKKESEREFLEKVLKLDDKALEQSFKKMPAAGKAAAYA